MENFIISVDFGTSSVRSMIFRTGTVDCVASAQSELPLVLPQHGWVEQDPFVYMQSTLKTIDKVCAEFNLLGYSTGAIKGVGITNQRETTIIWDVKTGNPLHNAIVWMDNRTAETVDGLIQKTPTKDKNYYLKKSGLPLSTYFSAVKIRWLMDHNKLVASKIKAGEAIFGTVDTWLIWNLTGGISGGFHVTDCTNASRTMLMDIESLEWSDELLNFFDIPRNILPKILSSSDLFGVIKNGPLNGVPICGCLGDQSAALVGQHCFAPGEAKNTYGTGCFMLFNTGTKPIISNHGLLTTIGYKFGDNPAYYALEGSIAIAGVAVRWLRDNLNFINETQEIEKLASSVDNTGGVVVVPAFSGLYAPHWRSDARGVICGLTQFSSKAHIARAVLESVCFQTVDILTAMNKDSGVPLTSLRVDGGMTCNDLLMQMQANYTNINLIRPEFMETTALGAAIAAGQYLKIWDISPNVIQNRNADQFVPNISEKERSNALLNWNKALLRSFGWISENEIIGLNEDYVEDDEKNDVKMIDNIKSKAGHFGVFTPNSITYCVFSNPISEYIIAISIFACAIRYIFH